MVELSEADSNNWGKLSAHLSKPQPIGGEESKRRKDDDEFWRSAKQIQRRFTSDEELAVVEDYRAGGNVYSLAEKYRCHRNTISQIVKGNRLRLKTSPTNSGKNDEALRLYESGLSMDATTKRLGISPKSMFDYLHRRGVPTRGTD